MYLIPATPTLRFGRTGYGINAASLRFDPSVRGSNLLMPATKVRGVLGHAVAADCKRTAEGLFGKGGEAHDDVNLVGWVRCRDIFG